MTYDHMPIQWRMSLRTYVRKILRNFVRTLMLHESKLSKTLCPFANCQYRMSLRTYVCIKQPHESKKLHIIRYICMLSCTINHQLAAVIPSHNIRYLLTSRISQITQLSALSSHRFIQ
uniref:Uncharacterized protein n=1 Tax=Cacopsylla melanoneura TaxID=428564 RepID=A0A8D8PNT1_9HEMI